MSDDLSIYYNRAKRVCEIPEEPACRNSKNPEKNISPIIDLAQYSEELAALASQGSFPIKKSYPNPLRVSTLALLASVLPLACNEKKETSTAFKKDPKTLSPIKTVPKKPDPWNLKSEGNRRVQIEMDGDPKIGTIVFFRQYHRTSKKQQDGSIRGPAIAKYQAEILKILEEYQIEHVFGESLTKTGKVPLDGSVNGYNIPSIRKQMGVPPLKDPTEFQLKIIYTFHAPYTYGIMHPHVTLHATLSPKEQLELQQKLKQALTKDGKARRHFFQETNPIREARATQRMIQFLKKNPGSHIALVYGFGHDFVDDFEKEGFTPRILSVFWHISPLDDWKTSRKLFDESLHGKGKK